jgi:fibro-slime domain-containing protein
MDIWLEPDPLNPDFFVFDSDMFFPLDQPGYIDVADAVNGHNFGFTTELRTAFEYKGGEIFTFRGDDDVFAFINGQLAVDIGGIHNAETESVDLDAQAGALGLEIGEVYDLVLYQAERNPGASNYRIETSLDFKSCGILPGDIVVK